MTVEELRAIPELHKKLEKDRERLYYLRELSTTVPALRVDPDRVQTTVVNRSMLVADEVIDLERSVEELAGILADREREALELFEPLPEPERKILKLFYVGHFSIREIGEILFFSPRWVLQLKEKGIAEIEF